MGRCAGLPEASGPPGDLKSLIPVRVHIADSKKDDLPKLVIRNVALDHPVLYRAYGHAEVLRQLLLVERRLDQTTRLFRKPLIVDDLDNRQDERGNRVYDPLSVLVLIHAAHFIKGNAVMVLSPSAVPGSDCTSRRERKVSPKSSPDSSPDEHFGAMTEDWRH